MTLFDNSARPREDLPGTGKWRDDVSLSGIRPSAALSAAAQASATTVHPDGSPDGAGVATLDNRDRFIGELLAMTTNCTSGGLGQLYDLWVVKANQAKDMPMGVNRWNVTDAGTDSACYAAMDEVAPHNHTAKPGDTLDVAQHIIGAEVGAQVTISHYRRGDNCGNAMTVTVNDGAAA
jgi:hypothetical protein